MSFNNIIAIVGDKFDAINLISSKLVLLRDLDKIVDTNLENASAFLSQTMPNVIILHAKGDSEESLDTLRDIKNTEVLKDIPILLYSEECTKEFLIDAFDSGITDIIKAPIADWELLIRVIWCIQKNEITINNDARNNFFTKLGIIQNKTGFYTEEYAEQYLDSEIESAMKYKMSACLMLVGPDSKFPPFRSMETLSEIIKKSIRLNDAVGIREDNKYYIFLPKTKLNGAYAVFERINNNLGLDSSINAAVSEIKNDNFSDIKRMLENTFEKTKDNTKTLLVAHEILVDEEKAEENIKTPDIIERRVNLKEKFANSSSAENRGQILPPNGTMFRKADSGSDFTGDTLLNLQNEGAQDRNPAPLNQNVSKLNPGLPDIEVGNFSEEEERNANLFRQAFKKKCELVTTPVFEKFKAQVENQNLFIDINKKIDFSQSYFELRKDDKMLRLTVNYPGFSKVDIVTEIFFGTEKKGYNAFSLDLTEYNFNKLSITLEGLINEYESYL